MPRVVAVRAAGTWTGSPVDRVVLDFDGRYRRRMALTLVSGNRALLDLAETRVLRDGDALVTDTGTLIVVEAAPERLAEIHCHDPGHLLRVAWQRTAIAGHRDTHFGFLRRLRRGDEVTLTGPDGVERRYRGEDAAVVEETDLGVLAPTHQPTLTLVTCYPFDALQPGGSLRYVVRAPLSGS